MVDVIDMKHRVAAAKARLTTADAGNQDRDQRLLSLLEAVEKTYRRMQRENRALRMAEAAARVETQQLRKLLRDVLSLAESERAIAPGLAQDDLERLIERLDEIAAAAARTTDESACGTER
jgi:hypothetical protein